jgi:hypothetical protein
MRFKRNQMEAAISRVLEGSVKPSSELRTRLKRLLDTDRGLGRNKRSADLGRANFAFYGEDAPGRGAEIWFSTSEAFAVLTALRLMQHGWPQGFAVSILRSVRPELERQLDRILQQDPATLFDQQQIIRQAQPGDLVVGNTDPVFLTLISQDAQARSRSVKAAICRGQAKLIRFIRSEGTVGQGWSTFELVNAAHALLRELTKTKPSKRGRGSD